MRYIAINSAGFISRMTAKDKEEAYYNLDQIALNDGEDWIVLTEKTAEKMAKNILQKGGGK